jgi:hypothetical protein
MAELMAVDAEAYKADLEDGEAFLAKFGDKVPALTEGKPDASAFGSREPRVLVSRWR